MNAVVITGASGFIGLNTVKTFAAQNWHVYACVHRHIHDELAQLSAEGKITVLRTDVTNLEQLTTTLSTIQKADSPFPTAIVHCAGHASDVGPKKKFRKTNYESVQHLTHLTKQFNINKLVFISTTDVYGISDFSGQNEEELPYCNNRKNYYSEFKIKSEKWIKQNLSSDRYVIIRPAAVWGMGDKTLTPRIVNFLKHSPFIVHFGKWKGENRWPLAHVKNVANTAFLAATTTDLNGHAVNVVDQEKITINDFYDTLARIYFPNKRYRKIVLPLWVGKIIGKSVSCLSNLLRRDQPITDPTEYAMYSVSKNLDFGNQKCIQALKRHNIPVISFAEGCAQLNTPKKP